MSTESRETVVRMPSTADSAVQFGYSQIGYVYKTGALFTSTCYKAVGVDIPRHALPQAYRSGVELKNPRELLAPGDLVFMTTRIVQLYVGGGFVLAATKGGIVKTPVRAIWRAVRVTTPGGGQGLALAQPGKFSPEIVAGRRR